jgi:hypothetical protein
VRTVVTEALLDEARRFALRWACEHCAHFAADGEAQGRCGNGWPNGDHRAERLRVGDAIAFCKEFEG